MNIQETLDSVTAKIREVRAANTDQITLGQLIDKLRAVPVRDDREQDVCFDFEYAHPTDFDSWRGVYAELACGFTFEGSAPKLSEFIAKAEACVGQEFTGYKGGEFTMTRETPVWVANYGNSGGTVITDVYDEGWQVVLLTAYRPY
jgi:hypothetical protein